MHRLRGVVVYSLFSLLLVACSDGPTEPTFEENFEFSAKVERSSYLGLSIAHHEVGAELAPSDFRWPNIYDLNGNGNWGEWSPDSSPAHSVGMGMGFGFGPSRSGEKFRVEYNLEWVNGETERPFTYLPVVVWKFKIHQNDVVAIGDTEGRYTLQQVGPTRYRAEFTLPTIATDGGYSLDLKAGLTLQCNAEGSKSFVISNVAFSGAGFSPSEHPGILHFTGECRSPLVRYSVVEG